MVANTEFLREFEKNWINYRKFGTVTYGVYYYTGGEWKLHSNPIVGDDIEIVKKRALELSIYNNDSLYKVCVIGCIHLPLALFLAGEEVTEETHG